MASRLCLHIGLHKTATTAIQDFLESQQVQLEGRGVRYISRAQWRSENRPGPAKRLANQVKTGASETLLLSEENLIGTPREFAEGGVYPESRKRLYALLSQVGNIPVDIIIVFRDPCRFLVSIYCEYVRNNHFMPFAEFIARHDVERFSWRRVFSWLYETPSNVRVHGLPFEQEPNPYITPDLSFDFHYFFMRKFWFGYLAKAVVVMPGGFGTLDEFFELLTLVQTGKIRKHMPIVLFGSQYWSEVINLEALERYGTINAEDLELFFRTDSVDEAFDFITDQLTSYALDIPGPRL